MRWLEIVSCPLLPSVCPLASSAWLMLWNVSSMPQAVELPQFLTMTHDLQLSTEALKSLVTCQDLAGKNRWKSQARTDATDGLVERGTRLVAFLEMKTCSKPII
ncbi:hypothetical protein O6H91_03G129800 [Diphasiastrum complanatum]|uniref:Uncharacterized protein n=1 Tax=Diphasiastrum complanatum TaxID=34168 RepID=A0ACC2EBN7_DIPCM|nr:hypothetical protein O6H91_03G129800 [Diphasiastrum complanatum]